MLSTAPGDRVQWCMTLCALTENLQSRWGPHTNKQENAVACKILLHHKSHSEPLEKQKRKN